MWQTILVPVDGSDSSNRALDVAVDLALRYGAELKLLHVMEEIGSSRVPPELEHYVKMEQVNVSERSFLEAVAKQIVSRAASRAGEAKVGKVGEEIRVGDPGHVIVDYAGETDAGLIVMGRRGFGRIRELFLGSVSHRVSQLCERDCLTVR